MKLYTKLLDKTIVADPKDNVATARIEINAGTVILYDGDNSVTIRENIPFGHKLALKQIAMGEPVIKYGQRIGVATRNIVAGELVHVHNLLGERGRGG